jgi:uncharacterized protein (DUF305 family)
MVSARYLAIGVVVVVLLIAAGGVGFVIGQNNDVTEERATSSSVSGDDTGSMMDSSDEDEEKPFDLQFIDEMIPHHQMALISSEHMISNSQRPEMRKLYENIQKSQSEQIEQMQEWRKEWYPDAGRPSEMMSEEQMGRMMDNGMMDGSMQGMMSGDALDTMFLKMMIPHHQTAVEMSDEALSKAEHPELRDLAQEIRDEQSSEIKLMQGYLETYS